jgi:hypothetical protein
MLNEIKAENFPSHRKDMDLQVQEAFRKPNRYVQKRTSTHHIIIRIPRIK